MASILSGKHAGVTRTGLKKLRRAGEGDYAFYLLLDPDTKRRLLHVDPKPGKAPDRFKNPVLITKHLKAGGYRDASVSVAELKKFRSLCGTVTWDADNTQYVFTITSRAGRASKSHLAKSLKEPGFKKLFAGADAIIAQPPESSDEDGLEELWIDTLLEAIWGALGEDASNAVTTPEQAAALHPDVLASADHYAVLIGMIEDYLADSERQGSAEMFTRAQLAAMVGPLEAAWSELLWDGISIDGGDLDGVDAGLVAALEEGLDDERAAVLSAELEAAGISGAIIDRLSNSQIDVLTSALRATDADTARSLLTPLSLDDDISKPITDTILGTVEHRLKVEEKRDAMIAKLLEDPSALSAFKSATSMGAFSKRDARLKALDGKLSALDGLGDGATLAEAFDLIDLAERDQDAWLRDPSHLTSERRLGVEALSEVLRCVEGLKILDKAGVSVKPGAHSLKAISAPLTMRLELRLVKPRPTATYVTELKTVKELHWDRPDVLARLAEMPSPEGSQPNARAYIEDTIASEAAYDFSRNQPKYIHDESFTPSVTVTVRMNIGPALYCYDQANDSKSGVDMAAVKATVKELARRLKANTKKSAYLDSVDRDAEAMIAGYHESLDAPLSDEKRDAAAAATEAALRAMGTLGLDLKARRDPLSREFQERRVGGSTTVSEDPAKMALWRDGVEKARRMAADPDHVLSAEDLMSLNTSQNPGDLGGKLRTGVSFAGTPDMDRTYLHPSKVDEEFKALIEWVNAQLADPDADPIETAGRAYQRYISIHPFADGNGRTGKLLTDYILQKRGLPPATLDPKKINVGIFGMRKHHGEHPGSTPDLAVEAVRLGVLASIEHLQG